LSVFEFVAKSTEGCDKILQSITSQ